MLRRRFGNGATHAVGSSRAGWWRGTGGVLGAAVLFNLGQGVLRPTTPLYLQQVFTVNYRMVTAIPAVFGAGKWIASLPTGYLLGRLGRRPLMVSGLLLIAASDVASMVAPTYSMFVGFRALAGVGWAMFGTVATATMVGLPAARRRGRAVSLLMMSESAGLLLGTASGGWLYQRLGAGSPFGFEAACMLVATSLVARWTLPPATRAPGTGGSSDKARLSEVLRTPDVLGMSMTSAVLTAVQTGVLVFLFPLYLVDRGLAPPAVGLLTSLAIVGRLVALWLGGTLSDRWGRPRVLLGGLFLCAGLLAAVPLLTTSSALGLSSLALGAAAGFVAPLPTAVIADRTAGTLQQALAIGWLRTMTDSGQILGPLVMGACGDALGLSAPFELGAIALIVTALACGASSSVTPATAPRGGH